MDRHIRTHQRILRVTAAEVVEGSPIFLVFRVNFLTSSVVLGSEREKVLKMYFHNPAHTPRLTHPLSHRMATDRIGLFYQNPV